MRPLTKGGNQYHHGHMTNTLRIQFQVALHLASPVAIASVVANSLGCDHQLIWEPSTVYGTLPVDTLKLNLGEKKLGLHH